MTEKDLAYYRRLPYTRNVDACTEEAETYFLARVEEIPFIQIDAPSREEALARLQELFDDCVQAMIDSGEEIFEPAPWPGGVPQEQTTLALPGTPARTASTTEGTIARVDAGQTSEDSWQDIMSGAPGFELASA